MEKISDTVKAFEAVLFGPKPDAAFGAKKPAITKMRKRFKAGTMAPATMEGWLQKAAAKGENSQSDNTTGADNDDRAQIFG